MSIFQHMDLIPSGASQFFDDQAPASFLMVKWIKLLVLKSALWSSIISAITCFSMSYLFLPYLPVSKLVFFGSGRQEDYFHCIRTFAAPLISPKIHIKELFLLLNFDIRNTRTNIRISSANEFFTSFDGRVSVYYPNVW